MNSIPPLTVNTFLALIIKAKQTGTGKCSNGELLVELCTVLSDLGYDGVRKRFASEPGKGSRQTLNVVAGRLRDDLKKYPYPDEPYGILLTKFQRFCHAAKPNGTEYMRYLENMHRFCQKVLDEKQLSALTYSLLELMRCDGHICTVFYNNRHIPKEMLLGSRAHPKRICLEALLIGLWYHVQMTKAAVNARELDLMQPPEPPPFFVFLLGNKIPHISRQEYSAIEHLLDLEQPVTIQERLQNVMPESVKPSPCYPLETEYCGKRLSAESLLQTVPGNLFLYGSGGAGKSFFLRQQKGLYLPLSNYKKEVREQLLPDRSCWILVHLLLKYDYRNAYQTFESCAAVESEPVLLHRLMELYQLLQNAVPFQYTLLLDGFNELLSERQDALEKELRWICREWQNVRIIITGRTVPQYALFDTFQHLELSGLPERVRDDTLSVLPDHLLIMQNEGLLEILKTPLFLNMYLESQKADSTAVLNTRGEILESYVTQWEPSAAEQSAMGFDETVICFIVQYALPFAAKTIVSRYDFEMDRADLLDAIDLAYETYVEDDRIYQNCIAPLKMRKKILLDSRDNSRLTELLLENVCFLTALDMEKQKLAFTHQYFRDYFAAKYILNLLNAMETAYGKNRTSEKAAFFKRFGLGDDWFNCEADHEIYRLIGELCGDYKNRPDKDGCFQYHRTILDTLLDTYRELNRFYSSGQDLAVRNVIDTMRIVRDGIVCGVDFSNTLLSIPTNIQYSLDGRYPSSFRNCRAALGLDCEMVDLAAYAPDGNAVLFVWENTAVLWDLQEEKARWELYLHSGIGEMNAKQAAFSPDGSYITLLLADTAVLLDAAGNVVFRYTKAGYCPDSTVLFSGDSKLWFAHLNQWSMLINLQTHQRTAIPAGSGCQCIVSAAFSHDSSRLLLADSDGTVTIWDNGGKLVHKRTFEGELQQTGFFPDDSVCLICTERQILCWDMQQDEIRILHTQSENSCIIYAVFSPDMQYCAAMSHDQHFQLISISTGGITALPYAGMEQIVFSPDSRYLLFVTDDDPESDPHTKASFFRDISVQRSRVRKVILYDITAGTYRTMESFRYSVNPPAVTALFSPDSSHFLLCRQMESMPLEFVQYTVCGERTALDIPIQPAHFKGCNFSGASFLYPPDRAALRWMGAVVDEDDSVPEAAEQTDVNSIF